MGAPWKKLGYPMKTVPINNFNKCFWGISQRFPPWNCQAICKYWPYFKSNKPLFSELVFKKLCFHLHLDWNSNKFQICIFLFLSYSFGILMINTFIHSHNSLENHTHFQTKMVQKTCPLGWQIPSIWLI